MKLKIFTDGGARGNPGPAAIGVVVKDERGRRVVSFGRSIGRATNNEAEYQAVLAAMDWVLTGFVNHPLSRIDFFLDSLLLVNQLQGRFKVKAANLKPLFFKVKEREKKIKAAVFYHSLPRQKNWEADSLVNQALDREKEEKTSG